LIEQVSNPAPSVPEMERPSLPATMTIATASALEYLGEEPDELAIDEVAKQVREVVKKEIRAGKK
jgi:hypothetical protein